MYKIFDNFNDFLAKRKAIAILEAEGEGKINCVISPKSTGNYLQQFILRAIEESKSVENAEIISAESYDYDYAVEMKVQFNDNGDIIEDTFHLTFATLY